MGVSSDGCLYFGFPVGEDEEPPEWLADVEDHDFELFLIDKAGMTYENTPYEERNKIIKSCPADLQRYRSWEYPMYILAVRGCEYSVRRGYFEEITPEMLKVDQSKIDAFKEWCEQNNIEYKEPKWLLCSMYG